MSLCIHSCLYLEYVLIAVDHLSIYLSFYLNKTLFKWNTTFSVLDRFGFGIFSSFYSNNSNNSNSKQIVNGFVSILVVGINGVCCCYSMNIRQQLFLLHPLIFCYFIENILKFLNFCFCFSTWKINFCAFIFLVNWECKKIYNFRCFLAKRKFSVIWHKTLSIIKINFLIQQAFLMAILRNKDALMDIESLR